MHTIIPGALNPQANDAGDGAFGGGIARPATRGRSSARWLAHGLATVSAFSLAATAHAQTTPAAPETASPPPAVAPVAGDQLDASSDQLQDIIVTAQKRSENLQRTPLAITAISSDAIETQGLNDFSKVQFVAPGLVYAEVSDMAQITMRGIGVDISTMDAEPGVALYVDGVYRGGLTSSAQTFFDLERMEVLRGPQGTLYGRNSTGGALNVITRLPGDTLGIDGSMLYGAYGHVKVNLGVDVPVVRDLLSVRAVFAYDTRDGYRTNEFLHTKFDAAQYRNGKVAVVLTPASNVKFVARAEWGSSDATGPQYQKVDEHPVPPFLFSPKNPGGALTAIPGLCAYANPNPALTCAQVFNLNLSPPGQYSSDPNHVLQDGSTLFKRRSWGMSGTLTWDVSNDLRVKWIGGYFDGKQNGNLSEADGTTIRFLTQNFVQKNREWSQEVDISGRVGTRLDWIVGGFYYRSDMDVLFDFTLPALQSTLEALYGGIGNPAAMGMAPLPPGTLAFFQTKIDGSRDATPWIEARKVQKLDSVAAFGQATYRLADNWRVTGGIRWTQDTKVVTQWALNNISGPAIAPATEPPTQCRGLVTNNKWQDVTWKVGTDFSPSDQTMLYGSVSTGFKAGGISGYCGNRYDPEKLLAFEGGFKSRWFDNKLQLNAAGFYYDYKDLQTRLFLASQEIVKNASSATTYGAEVEGVVLPFRGLRLETSLSWLHARFRNFVASDPMNPTVGTNCDATGLDCMQQLEGKRLVRAPDLKLTLAAEYGVTIGEGSLSLRGEYAYTAKQYFTFFNNDFSEQPAFGIGNLRLTWAPAASWGKDLRFQAFVENVANKQYVQSYLIFTTAGGAVAQFAPPRTWGVSASFKWGGK